METIKGSFRRHAYLCSYGSEQICELDMLDQQDYDVLSMILEHRRSLPVYRSGVWYCHECRFYTATIEAMGRHLLLSHNPAPPDREDLHKFAS